METIKLEQSKLSSEDVDNLLAYVQNISTVSFEDEAELVMRDVRFIDPYALIGLCLSIRCLQKSFKEVRVVFPDDFETASYLAFMNFNDHISPLANLSSGWNTVSSQDRSDILVKITPIGSDSNFQEEALGVILNNQLNFSQEEVTSYTTVVSELCHNIVDHSEDAGYLAAQRYTNHSTGKRFVMIAVGDLGIGMRSALKKRYEEAEGWSHYESIVKALQKEATSSSTGDRGLGLSKVHEITKKYSGSLRIRSGDASFYFRNNRAYCFNPGFFPGVQVMISLAEVENT
ncbi:MAG: ATP-binding protein [Candidatus Omnitrophica bacterium]|nr:ATP-binding protein [Candidatus Omnitrophota bacterium]